MGDSAPRAPSLTCLLADAHAARATLAVQALSYLEVKGSGLANQCSTLG